MSHSFLTLDLATMSGICLWVPGSQPIISSSDLSTWYSHDYAKALAIHYKRIKKIIEENEVTHVCFEKPISLRTDSTEKLRKVFGLSSTVELLCGQMRITCSEAIISQWRKHVLGHGMLTTVEAKRRAMNIARGVGLDPKNHDEAEAFCIMDYVSDILKIKKDWPEPYSFRLK